MSVATMICGGCGSEAPIGDPFRCPETRESDNVDHVLSRVLDSEKVAFPRSESDTNPFVQYRELTLAWRLGREHGLSDEELLSETRELSERVAEVDARRFTRTPLDRIAEIEKSWGLDSELWAKDETNNVSGSHKARHLMGVMLYLERAERLSLIEAGRPLAISSCGNAALAAAVIAKAAGRPIEVFVPTWADPHVVARLEGLGAHVHRCARPPESEGDPCTRAFRGAVADGAIPFSCQGSDNGLAIEGGMTLGYEMVAAMAQAPPDRIFIQIGGGALASACIQAWREAKAWGIVSKIPRIHAVQTENTAPLERAYRRLIARISADLPGASANGAHSRNDLESTAERARTLRGHAGSRAVARALRHAATHRSEYMWPWESVPESIAHGILDDETYDWLAVVRGMVASGGYPVTVSEDLLEEAKRTLRSTTDIRADATGSAGLAGLARLHRAGLLESGERSVVLLTGVDRGRETRG